MNRQQQLTSSHRKQCLDRHSRNQLDIAMQLRKSIPIKMYLKENMELALHRRVKYKRFKHETHRKKLMIEFNLTE